jgi:hypothetical protein
MNALGRSIRFLVLMIFSASCLAVCGQKSKDVESELLTTKFLTADSVIIRLTYHEIPGCTVQTTNEMNVLIIDGVSWVQGNSASYGLWRSGLIQGSVLDEFAAFERQAKIENTTCGGYGGGTGVLVEMEINGERTEFGYCQDTWDGIGELLEQVKKRAR